MSAFFFSTFVCWINHIIEYICTSFSLVYSIPLCEYITMYLSILLLMGIQVVCRIANITTKNILVSVFWWTRVHIYLGHRVCSALRDTTSFEHGCTNHYFHQQCLNVPVPSHLYWYLAFSVFFILAIHLATAFHRNLCHLQRNLFAINTPTSLAHQTIECVVVSCCNFDFPFSYSVCCFFVHLIISF